MRSVEGIRRPAGVGETGLGLQRSFSTRANNPADHDHGPSTIAPTSNDRYDALSQALHWLTALVVLIAFVLGPEGFGRLVRQGVDPSTRPDIVWHETLGIFVLLLTLTRLLWLAWRPPAPRLQPAGGMRAASRALHGLLWALLILLPVTALLTLSAEGQPLTLLGGLGVERLPMLGGESLSTLADWGDVHVFLGDAIVWLAGLHAVAAIVHHHALKDGVLRAMLPRWLVR